MKNLATALDNELINKQIIESKQYNVVTTDITYKEGILEILEKNKIDILILKENLPGQINFKELINKILEKGKNIELIILLENENKEIEEFLISKGIKNIFYNNQLINQNLINKIKNKEEKNKKEEINKIKKIILNNKKINKKNYLKNNKKNKKITISILGDSKIEKNIFTTNLAQELKSLKRKVLILDLDILNPSINTIFGIKKFPEELDKSIDLKDKIKNIDKNIDVISGIDFIVNTNNYLLNIEELIKKLKKDYDIILIDTSSDCFFDLTKMVINISNISLFLTGTKICQIKKAINLLKIYIKEFKINKNKIKIIYYKNNKEKNPKKILKNIFHKNKIIGSIKLPEFKEEIYQKNIGNIYNNLNNKFNYLKIKFNLKKLKII